MHFRKINKIRLVRTIKTHTGRRAEKCVLPPRQLRADVSVEPSERAAPGGSSVLHPGDDEHKFLFIIYATIKSIVLP